MIERRITRDEVYVADEVFLPTVCLNDAGLFSGSTYYKYGPGPVTLQLQEAFFAAVKGESSTYPQWLTLV